MTNVEMRELYEKLYFHEVEAREKIHARLQLPLTLIVAIAGAMAFLFQNSSFEFAQWKAMHFTFAALLLLSAVAHSAAIWWFIRAFYDHMYYFLPAPAESAAYHRQLQELYAPYANSADLVSDAFEGFLTDKYIEYGTFNASVNDRRSAFIHRCSGAIIAAVVFLAAAFIAFAVGDLDKAKDKKPTPVEVTKPIDVRIK